MGKQNWKLTGGFVLIIVSSLIFASLLLIPLLKTTDQNKILISTGSILVAEIMFWGGGLLLGRQLFDKYKSYLNPKNWFNRQKENGT
jgi:hypothetical protein